MSISVKFFASLRENLKCSDLVIEKERLPEKADAMQIWNIATHNKPLPKHTLCAVNHEHCQLNQYVNDGDEVAFFPPITGG